MIERTIYDAILHSISVRPVTLITGARQVGKTTLCKKLSKEKGFGYVTLRDKESRAMARKDPDLFLSIHPWPLIVDEVQYAPELLESIESVVDKEQFENGNNKGMYVLTGSQAYKLMEKASDSLAGRISLLKMSPLTISEIASREEIPFSGNLEQCARRSLEIHMDPLDVFRRIVRGTYPEPEANTDLSTYEFYSDYVSTYIDRDVSEIINVKNKEKFHDFMQVTASLTGQILNYNTISAAVGIDNKTAKSWMSVLITGDIVHLVEPYNEKSTTKRVSKSPKLYFWDTGLACHLARVLDAESLIAGYLKGPMLETFIVNEIIKTYRNRKTDVPTYFYRENERDEIDLVMIKDGKMTLVECKSGTEFGRNDIKLLDKGIGSSYPVAGRFVICLARAPYPINDKIYALPVTSI